MGELEQAGGLPAVDSIDLDQRITDKYCTKMGEEIHTPNRY